MMGHKWNKTAITRPNQSPDRTSTSGSRKQQHYTILWNKRISKQRKVERLPKYHRKESYLKSWTTIKDYNQKQKKRNEQCSYASTNSCAIYQLLFVFEKSSEKIMLVLSDSTLKTSHFHINKAWIIYSTTPLILNQAFTWTKKGCQPKPNH